MKGRKKMKQMIRNNLKYLIFLFVSGLVGGYFTAIYSIQGISQEMLDEAIAQAGSLNVVILASTVQSIGYTLILGIIGKILAKKIGLWRKIEFTNEAIRELLLVTIVGGIVFIMADHLVFNNFSEVIKNSYAVKPTFEYIIASLTYGGVVEEIMLRLFFMSLIAFIIQKIGKKEETSNKILVIANIIVAMLFAAGHLPATAMTIGLTPIIVLRCFLLNGGFGLLFGRLYRKYGIHYAMLAHAGVHIVSKLIWIFLV